MKQIVIIPLLLALFACNNAGKAGNTNREKMEQLADRSCRAKSLNKQRFALADSIRFAQDTLGHSKTAADSARLQARLKVCLAHKAVILKQSLALADTIRLQMDSLIPYTDKAAERRFNASFDSLLAKKGCK